MCTAPAFFHGRKSKPPGPLTALALLVLVSNHFHGSNDQALVFGSRNTPASFAFCWPADGALIGLNQSRQMTSGLVDHTFAQSMQPVPGGCITSNAPLPLELGGADSWCVCRHQIGCPEPLSDRDMGAVHGCARGGRGLAPTCSTQKQRPCG